MRRATKLVTNSHYSQGEIERNIGFPPERVEVVHHGVPDPYGDLPPDEGRRRMALSVGFVTRDNLEIKGQRAFVEAAAELPDVEFVLAGPWKDDGVDVCGRGPRRTSPSPGGSSRTSSTGCSARASVYVQPSHHEGFGIAVAEAMLAGCVPVVTRAGALPESWTTPGSRSTATRPRSWPTASGARSRPAPRRGSPPASASSPPSPSTFAVRGCGRRSRMPAGAAEAALIYERLVARASTQSE